MQTFDTHPSTGFGPIRAGDTESGPIRAEFGPIRAEHTEFGPFIKPKLSLARAAIFPNPGILSGSVLELSRDRK